MTKKEIVRTLRSLPLLRPNAAWKERTKQRLLAAYDAAYDRVKALRHWAIYVSSSPDAGLVADAIVARGQQWRPVAVQPERAMTAVAALNPALVIVDSRLPQRGAAIAGDVRRASDVLVVSDEELLSQVA